MRILLANYQMNELTGSDTYTYTMAEALNRHGHNVVVFTPFPGIVSDNLSNDIPVTNSLNLSSYKFDVAHVHHNVIACKVREQFPDLPIISVCHGTVPFLEQPVLDLNIHKFIAVSDEVFRHLQKKNVSKDKLEIIRNAVDIKRFYPEKPINEKLKNVLVLSNHVYGDTKKMIQDAAKKLNLNLTFIGKQTKAYFNIEEYINKNDLVITIGRGVLESMACGRVVLIYDKFGGDGVVTRELIHESKLNNFSGRRYGKKYTTNDFIKVFKEYDYKQGVDNRELAEKCFNIDNRLDEFEKIYIEAINEFVPASIPPSMIFKIYKDYLEYNFKLWKKKFL